MRVQNSIAASIVDWEVCNPGIISTPFWTGTGFIKCAPMTRDAAERLVGSVVVDAAIRVIEIDEVLVARTA